MNSVQISLSIAFMAGLASFFSPCVLPLVPIYLAQLVGPSIYQNGEETKNTFLSARRVTTLLHAASFVGGFTLAFIALGATASSLGSFLRMHMEILREVGGVILILLGLHLTGILKLTFLYQQRRFTFIPERPGYPASFVVGIIFAIAWSPCLGPILASILIIAANTATLQQGVLLLLLYSIGLGIPFLLLGLGLNQMSRLLAWMKPHLGKVELITGIAIMIVGVVVYFNMLNVFRLA